MSYLSSAYPWLMMFGVLAVSGVLVYIARWALFADRANGRRRCPRCWYDLAYTTGMTCGECGFLASHESQFGKTRRRYGIAGAAIAAAVAITLYVQQTITQRGLVSLLPTQMLLWLMPLSSEPRSAIFSELNRRASQNGLSSGQWEKLIDRCVLGDWGCRPPSDEWIAKYGAFVDMYRRQIDRIAVQGPLRGLPPRIDAATREVWPADTPITVTLQIRDWWPDLMECRVRATPRFLSDAGEVLESGKPVVFYRGVSFYSMRQPYVLDLPALPESTRRLALDLEIDRRVFVDLTAVNQPQTPAQPADWEPVAARTITLNTQSGGPLQQVTQCVSDEAATAAVQLAFNRPAMKWNAAQSPVRFQTDPTRTAVSELNDTAVGVCVELLRDDDVARRLNIWWLGGLNVATGSNRNHGFEVVYEDQDLLRQVNVDDGRWRMRVRGNPQVALRAGNAPKHWLGEFTFPLALEPGRSASPPPRGWWTDDE